MLQLTGGSVFRAQPMEKVSLLAKRGLILIFQENPPCVRKNFDPTEGMHLLAMRTLAGRPSQKVCAPSIQTFQAHKAQVSRAQFEPGPARTQRDLKKPERCPNHTAQGLNLTL